MQPLNIIVELLETFHEQKINYCHWKSNDHVEEGLCGITDLDIVVDRAQSNLVQAELSKCGFKRGAEGFGARLPGVEGYLGLDKESGKMAYIHLHYQLVLGKNRLKDYSFKWENLLLKTRRFKEDKGIYVADPDIEMILLIVRACTKIRWRDILRDLLGIEYFRGNWSQQYNWLKKEIDLENAVDKCSHLLGKNAALILEEILKGGVNINLLLKFKSCIKDRAALYRVYPSVSGCLLMWLKELHGFASFVNKKFLRCRMPFVRKGISTGGHFIALLGPDGSGKSTVCREIASTFAWKLDVHRAYLGAGDGQSSILRWPLLRLLKMLERLKIVKAASNKPVSANSEKSAASGKNSKENVRKLNSNILRSFAICLWALTLSYEKRIKIKAAWRSRHQGMVVISDRYPQAQVMGFNDGPLLGNWLNQKNRLLRYLAHWEFKPYLWADENSPDLVIRLNITPQTAQLRDPSLTMDFVKRRIKTIQSLKFAETTKVFDLDANRKLEDVLLDVKNIIWNSLP